MARRGTIVLVIAAGLAAADLMHKATATTPEWTFHSRSGAWELLAATIVVGCLALTRVPSTAVAGAAGILAGGTFGNLISSLSSARGIPNPILVGDDVVIAFNLADVFALAGIGSLMVALIAVTIRNREQLLPPREVARRLRQRLSA